MLLTAHVRWLQTGPTYDGNVGVARFPDFSPMRKLEIYLFRPLPLLQKGCTAAGNSWYQRLPTRTLHGVVRAPQCRSGLVVVELYLRSARLGFAFSAIGPR